MPVTSTMILLFLTTVTENQLQGFTMLGHRAKLVNPLSPDNPCVGVIPNRVEAVLVRCAASEKPACMPARPIFSPLNAASTAHIIAAHILNFRKVWPVVDLKWRIASVRSS